MSYNLREIRSIANGTYVPYEGLSESAIKEIFLDEAYYGRSDVKQIEQIMAKIEKKISANSMVDLDKEPESKELDNALVKIFGFKSAHVYWERTPDSNPCTLPAARVINQQTKDLQPGSYQNGMYDRNHSMVVFVQMDTAIVSHAHCTPAEMTAVLLHELGHNFDYTPYACLRVWFDVINTLINGLITGKLDRAIQAIALKGLVTSTDAGRKLYMDLMNLEDQIGKALPPVGYFLYGAQVVTSGINKLLNIILIPVVAGRNIPMALMYMPIRYLSNFFLRKSETYADSVAAAYGYGPEIVTGLEKIMKSILTFNNAPRGVFTIFDNYVMLYQEIFSLAQGGHGSQQQRARKMIDSLRRDIEDPRLDKATRKACKEELDRLEKTYNDIVYAPDDSSLLLTKALRILVDQWYKGTAPKLMPIVDPDNTFVR